MLLKTGQYTATSAGNSGMDPCEEIAETVFTRDGPRQDIYVVTKHFINIKCENDSKKIK